MDLNLQKTRARMIVLIASVVGLGFAALLIVSGCASTPNKTKRIEAVAAMESAVADIVRAGMTIDEVCRVMESEGFKCKLERQSTFVEMRSFRDMQPRRENIDFVRCTRTDLAGFAMTRYWSIAVLLNGDSATGDIAISHFIDGL